MGAKKFLTLCILFSASILSAADQTLQDFKRFQPEAYQLPYGPNAPWNIPIKGDSHPSPVGPLERTIVATIHG